MTPELKERYDLLAEWQPRALRGMEEKIRKGTALLDAQKPGWASEIDVQKFQFHAPTGILEQLHFFPVPKDKEWEYGFAARYSSTTLEGGMSDHAWMQILWKEEISKRV